MAYTTVLGKEDIQMMNRLLKCLGIHSISKYLEKKVTKHSFIDNVQSFEIKATDLWSNSENKIYLTFSLLTNMSVTKYYIFILVALPKYIYSSLSFQSALILDYE